jgi:hypothetical protein
MVNAGQSLPVRPDRPPSMANSTLFSLGFETGTSFAPARAKQLRR